MHVQWIQSGPFPVETNVHGRTLDQVDLLSLQHGSHHRTDGPLPRTVGWPGCKRAIFSVVGSLTRLAPAWPAESWPSIASPDWIWHASGPAWRFEEVGLLDGW